MATIDRVESSRVGSFGHLRAEARPVLQTGALPGGDGHRGHLCPLVEATLACLFLQLFFC